MTHRCILVFGIWDDVSSPLLQVIDSVDGNYLNIRGVRNPVLNVASFDFLGMSLEPSIKKKAADALDYYGCGSCGPRGFYGTIDQHLMFEEAIAKFMGTEVKMALIASPLLVVVASSRSCFVGFLLGGDFVLGQRIDSLLRHSCLL